jgi:hypothetical protein
MITIHQYDYENDVFAEDIAEFYYNENAILRIIRPIVQYSVGETVCIENADYLITKITNHPQGLKTIYRISKI